MDAPIKTIFGTGVYPLGPEDYRESKNLQEYFYNKKLEGFNT